MIAATEQRAGVALRRWSTTNISPYPRRSNGSQERSTTVMRPGFGSQLVRTHTHCKDDTSHLTGILMACVNILRLLISGPLYEIEKC
jgi:hypothetical protein